MNSNNLFFFTVEHDLHCCGGHRVYIRCSDGTAVSDEIKHKVHCELMRAYEASVKGQSLT